ncbi:Ferredoxin [Candidatus Nitrosotalea sp. TS]|uniref:4Fe-4S dicluster domain-containing protein n=1 Tax=Candidatus Nitrosotalea sp. TS TaxID=2341020 RepID=UPI00140D3174|nr:4Fe-4S binding protein [Candidatus Nitrosotalea sp. TS]NHI04482.1 Ferredoxin [Candidatus Nitrosotalea sp. TS]
MSLLLKDKVYSVQSATSKRGIYPLHSYKLGLYRLPIKLEDKYEIDSIVSGFKKVFVMDQFADRVYATYRWKEENMPDPDERGYKQIELEVQVEVVTGEVVDMIYQIYPIEKYGDGLWVKDYRRKADANAKMMIDTILRNSILADKMIEHIVKTKQVEPEIAIKELEEMTPLAQIVPNAKPKPKPAAPPPGQEAQQPVEIETPSGAKQGPIDVEFKSKLKVTETFTAPSSSNKIKIFGPRKGNEVLGIWGEFVSVDFDVCVGDGACIDACPVKVYEWADFQGSPSSDKKPLMAREPDCIFCLACENVCPVQAIKISKKG